MAHFKHINKQFTWTIVDWYSALRKFFQRGWRETHALLLIKAFDRRCPVTEEFVKFTVLFLFHFLINFIIDISINN